MTTEPSKTVLRLSPDEWIPLVLIGCAWAGVTAVALSLIGMDGGFLFGAAAAMSFGLTVAMTFVSRWKYIRHLARLNDYLTALSVDPSGRFPLAESPEFAELNPAMKRLFAGLNRRHRVTSVLNERPLATIEGASGTTTPMTRSGLHECPSGVFEVALGGQASSEFRSSDMVNRLDPRLFRWLESSPAEQYFLGWDLKHLREKSFFEIVHPDDLKRAREQLTLALEKGEVHGLILRIRTASGKPKAIEMNVGARYGPDMAVSHLRCHVSDVTMKLRSERELKLRTRELTQVNDQLRLINRELEELKERYRDLYQNAPAMYFSLDNEGRIVDANDTLLQTLGYRREAVKGQPYELLLPERRREEFARRFEEFLQVGTVEVESEWLKANGDAIDVWVTASTVRDRDGRLLHSRSVAQDITARHRLEAELKEKHQRLTRTNDELSRKNREMDEFTYVVSHDLQEPLRTLIAFSDFLLRDYGDRLDAEGQEFVRHIVDASRRMRSLIQDLLTLSRAGKVTAEFSTVDLESVLAAVRSDLAELIRARGGTVRVVAPLPEVWGDRDRIGQLLSNLVANGLKYNEKTGPAVEIGAIANGSESGSVTIYVKDDGIGIDPRFHAKIFQLFRRLHARDEYEGTGAGLAICSKIVQAHNGRIWVESQQGQGSTFFLSLPRPAAANSTPGEGESVDQDQEAHAP